MAKVIKTSGETIEVSPRNGTDFQLDELQEFVEGYIEIVYLDNGQLMVVNEEGKLEGLPYNPIATEMVVSMCKYLSGDVIVGNVLVCNGYQVK